MSYTKYVSDFGNLEVPTEILPVAEGQKIYWLEQNPDAINNIIDEWALQDWQNGFLSDPVSQPSLTQTILDTLSAKYGPHFAGYRISASGLRFDKFEVCISDTDHAALLLKLKFGGAA